MKGIILAGGAGTRLDPITRVASKQLQPVYDKPMVYYPLSILMQSGIEDILLISTPDDLARFEDLLGDGSQWGISLAYAEQPEPKGIAQAILIGAHFIGQSNVALILGDNIFHGEFGLSDLVSSFDSGAVIFGYPVDDPHRYGVVNIDVDGQVESIEEKPTTPRSHLAIPGLYLYDATCVERASRLTLSDRGELEITDLNRSYLEDGLLRVVEIGRGVAWLDSGTHDSLLEAANFVATIERRQGLKVACVEETAYRQGYIDRDRFLRLISDLPESTYKDYLAKAATLP